MPGPGTWAHGSAPLTMLCSVTRLTLKQGDYLSGLDLITWTLKQRRKAEIWMKHGRRTCWVTAGLEMEGSAQEGTPPATLRSRRPQREPCAASHLRGLGAGSSLEPPWRNAALLTLDFSLVRPWAESPAILCWTHELQNCELRNGCCLKLLNFG